MQATARFSRFGWQRLVVGCSVLLAAVAAHANPTTYSGSLADPSNSALIGSGPAPSLPSFDSPSDIANNVAMYDLMVPFGGFTDFTFGGFSDFTFSPLLRAALSPNAITGTQPYFTLFSGSGPSAVFLLSAGDLLTGTNPQLTLRYYLAAGNYVFTIGTYPNESVAESAGGGTLGQGFTGRGDPLFVGDGTYLVTVTTPTGVPEPDTVALAAIGAVALLLRRRRLAGRDREAGSR